MIKFPTPLQNFPKSWTWVEREGGERAHAWVRGNFSVFPVYFSYFGNLEQRGKSRILPFSQITIQLHPLIANFQNLFKSFFKSIERAEKILEIKCKSVGNEYFLTRELSCVGTSLLKCREGWRDLFTFTMRLTRVIPPFSSLMPNCAEPKEKAEPDYKGWVPWSWRDVKSCRRSDRTGVRISIFLFYFSVLSFTSLQSQTENFNMGLAMVGPSLDLEIKRKLHRSRTLAKLIKAESRVEREVLRQNKLDSKS